MNWKEILIGAITVAVIEKTGILNSLTANFESLPLGDTFKPAIEGALAIIVAEWLGNKF